MAGEMPSTARERNERRRELKRKKTFWQHVTVFALINGAFWISWIVGGLTDRWLAPWPLLPTIVWGLFILAHEYRLGGPAAVSHSTIEREIEELRNPVIDLRTPDPRPITFGDFTDSAPIPKFHWRDVIDARDLTEADASGQPRKEEAPEATSAG